MFQTKTKVHFKPVVRKKARAPHGRLPWRTFLWPIDTPSQVFCCRNASQIPELYMACIRQVLEILWNSAPCGNRSISRRPLRAFTSALCISTQSGQLATISGIGLTSTRMNFVLWRTGTRERPSFMIWVDLKPEAQKLEAADGCPAATNHRMICGIPAYPCFRKPSLYGGFPKMGIPPESPRYRQFFWDFHYNINHPFWDTLNTPSLFSISGSKSIQEAIESHI